MLAPVAHVIWHRKIFDWDRGVLLCTLEVRTNEQGPESCMSLVRVSQRICAWRGAEGQMGVSAPLAV